MSKQRFSFLTLGAAVIISVLFISSTADAADGNSPLCVIKGSVLDQNGSAVSGATIDGVTNGMVKATTTTDREGSFSLSLNPGAYILVIRASGFSSLERKVETCQTANDVIELRLEIDSVFPLAEARAAHERMESGEQFGKIILAIPG